ncbi:MAG TPA: TetR/AcrR family transcriptional regulator [Mycobacteriales bacterium]|jgi:AcrR family transcriptional regulator|nr:TetR/AcrR family transcriptional regulator [Mycobacteriales bacterium]
MTSDSAAPQTTGRRRYESPVRQQRAAQTRERIIASGVELVHSFTSWDWSELTFRATAQGAGVSESTVYRHFANERELHAAVMQRLHEQSGVSYAGIALDDIADVAAQVVTTMTSFAAGPILVEPADPTISSSDTERRRALLAAVVDATAGWTTPQQQAAASVLDVLWSPLVSERLITHWSADPAIAIQTMQWAIDLVVTAIRNGEYPGRPGDLSQ